MNWSKFFDGIIEYSFYILLFTVPLILTPYNYELFEFNKMMLVYFMTSIIFGAFLCRCIVNKKFEIAKTPLDIPIILFFLSQLISTLFSIDIHTSIWGYYSRFHGGLLSTICYVILYYVFVTFAASANNKSEPLSKSQLKKLRYQNLELNKNKSSFINTSLLVLLSSAFLITFYGVLEHFGIDAKYWIQDVKNRVFSTLGQPNWLGAWIDAIIFIPIVYILKKPKSNFWLWITTFFTFYFCLLFTGSRSAYYGFLTTLVSFLILLVIASKNSLWKKIIFVLSLLLFFGFAFLQEWKGLAIFKIATVVFILLSIASLQLILEKKLKIIINLGTAVILIISLFLGTPISKPLNLNFFKANVAQTVQPPILPRPKYAPDISNSSTIRQVVWKGAIEAWKHWPVFGSGVETFAYSYYNYRPREHNDLSEWDFLYNKAHNEFVNFLTTAGVVGLGTYLLLTGWFLAWATIKIFKKNDENILAIALIAGFASILVTNFFGFSVVPVAILFWIFPAIVFVLTDSITTKQYNNQAIKQLDTSQYLGLSIIGLAVGYFIFMVCRFWWADYQFSQGKKYTDAGYLLQAHELLTNAVLLNNSEPLYHSILAENASGIASVYYQKDASGSAQIVNQLVKLAQDQAQMTLQMNNVHLNYYKTIAKTYIYLGQVNPEYYTNAMNTLLKAMELSPTDAKISFNIGLLYQQTANIPAALQYLEKTVQLKPNYTAAHLALAKLYHQEAMNDKAKEELNFILENIEPNHGEAKNLLKEWEKLK